MDTLALEGEFLHKGVLLFRLFLRGEAGVGDLRDGAAHIREHEEVGVADGIRQDVVALVRHVHGVLDFRDDEVQLIRDGGHLLLARKTSTLWYFTISSSVNTRLGSSSSTLKG